MQYYFNKKKYFDNYDKEYNIYIKIKNSKKDDFIKIDPEKLTLSFLFELVNLLPNNKIELDFSDLSKYLQQLIINLIDEDYKKNEIEYKKDGINNSIIQILIVNKIEENKYYAIFRAKLFNKLIDYINNNYYDADNERKLNEIKQMNNEIIKNNINIFFELNLEYEITDIESYDIKDLYKKIISALIKTKKIVNYEFTEK